ncbi:MAG: glycosyl hydrolase family protein [Chitinophagaceae bacterium]|nr:MAG: glycosyl hydrolase family protein [Chitinophagaceae bacterium]
MRDPAIWGGIECTINRIGDSYYDQLEISGHYKRTGDLKIISTLGIKKLRYPILWEKHQPTEDTIPDFTWVTAQLEQLAALNITPIVGLIHHGSGPMFTSLEDPLFPVKLARYAGLVASKFPGIRYYTPVNEPLTTARFSGLYGHWYPHHATERNFFLLLVNQLKATILCMQSIRLYNPDAKLVQTEDLGYTHSSPILAYQADYENKRRLLTNDLLCGFVNRKHYFWQILLDNGIPEVDLNFFLINPCPPDIIGLNYYVTSERFLDHEDCDHPSDSLGNNGKQSYYDIASVRKGYYLGLSELIRMNWERYHIPVAVTECHINCTPDEQLRWIKEQWRATCKASRHGVNVVGFTLWSLLGAYDWDSLLTARRGSYENGVFRIESDRVMKTELYDHIRKLAISGDMPDVKDEEKGWWLTNT